MATELRIPIVATTRSDGKGKTKNATPDQVHREDVMNHEDAFFHTNIVMSACIHGTWDEEHNDKTPATFLVFTCEVQSMREFRARKIKIQIDFRNVNNEDGSLRPANPTIVSRGPEIIERFQKIPVLRKSEHGIRGAIDGGTVVKPGVTLHQISSDEYEKPYFAEAKSGVRHASPTDHRYVKVWWIYTENSKGTGGVAPGFRVAVLLKRDNNSPFQGQFAITEFDAGWRYPGAVVWHDFWSGRDPDAEEDKIIHPINFDPTKPEPVMPKWMAGVNCKQLVELHTETGIDKKYARVWGVDL
ncbi:hypothetical protein JDV02_009709 [Purpureocillium takamizusanense]|uniref:Uncharacterized protein n=1 Tax=Purpureocillium takamizusanense TaxID=2060973 RepID=A0A9Q8QQJ3_9HYPO|nr:uncharacterized protein JDV02_009709 [Purpureocillium takamizusanense]UNI23918.1 hypothetical protein JDV02_009709 [Purpureocillium takamizusanense]